MVRQDKLIRFKSKNSQFLIVACIAFLCWQCKTPSSSKAESADISFHSAQGKPPKAGSIFMYPERIPLKDGGFHNAERGMMFVPANRTKEKTDVIALEIYRFRASSKEKSKNPPIFFLAGGPSFEGLERDLEKLDQFEKRWKPKTDIADVVIVSQRGIGSSKPNTLIETTFSLNPPDEPVDYEKRAKDFRVLLTKEKNAWESMGVDLSGFTVLEAADDIYDVTKALGYEKIVIWGGSFGAHWGMALMRKYPELIERAILRGMEGPDHTYDHPGHLWNVYERVAEDAEKSKELAGLIPEEGLINALKEAIQKAEENPTVVNVEGQDVLIDGNIIKQHARGYSGNLRTWPAFVIDMYNGNYQIIAKRIAENYKDKSRRYRTASYWMLDCGSGITASRMAEYNADPATDIFTQLSWHYKNGCSLWGSDLGDDFRQNFETAIPTVITQGTWDTSTPYENAVELVPYFTDSKFVTVNRGHHGTINQASRISESYRKALHRFAETGDFSTLQDTVVVPIPEWTMPLKK